MTSKILILGVLSMWGFTANAQSLHSSFTLKGKNPYSPGQECFLYVDNFGYDENLPGTNKFYAEVRTSYQPSKSILLVAHPRMRFQMMSVDKFGRPSRELEVRLRGLASEQTLYRAFDYQGVIRLPWERPWRRIACAMLHPVNENQ